MKLYTHVTPTHAPMLQEFLIPSAKSSFEVVVFEGKQRCEGVFGGRDWSRSLREKAQSMARAAEESAGEVMVWADADVQLFGLTPDHLIERLGDHDMIFQHEKSREHLCAGFFAARGNQRVRDLLRRVACDDDAYECVMSDQEALNRLKHGVDWAVFPSGEFWTIGHTRRFPAARLREEAVRILLASVVPEEILMHHGNFVKGIENKLRLMGLVREIVSERRGSPAR